jgi:hypothetical protein
LSDPEYVKELEERIAHLEKVVSDILEFDPNIIFEKIESEVHQENPYKTRPDGTCPGCGTWAPEGHLEAHDHTEDCPMIKRVERWKKLDKRIYDRICDMRAKWTKYHDIY